MIAIVVPAHNEEAVLAGCLESLDVAALHPRLRGEPASIIVVLDDCQDRSEDIAREYGATIVKSAARCVGRARAAGTEYALRAGARWIACTDADSHVPADWLVAQLAHGADVVCGTVLIDDWSSHPVEVRSRYELAYTFIDGHRHIHGANLGFNPSAYRRAGGFPALRFGEDVAFVEAAERSGAAIAWVSQPSVRTDARTDFRAPHGFGAYLLSLGDFEPCTASRAA